TAHFSVTASGTGPFTYQWQSSTNNGTSWNDLSASPTTNANGTYSGAGTATLSLSPINTAWNGYLYRVVITTSGSGCTVTSNNAVLQIQAIAAVTRQSAAPRLCLGLTATFSVTASGTGPFTYLWQSSGNNGASWNNLSGTTTTTANGTYSGGGT